jgi:hypothetical protein
MTLVSRLAMFAALLSSAGCGLATKSYTLRDSTPGVPVTRTVGEPLVRYESGMKNAYDQVVSRMSKEFIYSGKAGSIVRFSYREFAGNARVDEIGGVMEPAVQFARPAFTQDVQYDLSESDVIAFRAMRLKVVRATSSEITVEVVRELEPLVTPASPPQTAPVYAGESTWGVGVVQ